MSLDYGSSVLDRYTYTKNASGVITSIVPDGINGNTTNAYFLGNSSTAPVKEGLQGTNNDIILVGGSHGSATTVLSRYTPAGALIGQVSVNFSAYNNGNPAIGNVAITPDGR